MKKKILSILLVVLLLLVINNADVILEKFQDLTGIQLMDSTETTDPGKITDPTQEDPTQASLPVNVPTQPAPTQPAPTQPAPTQPAPTTEPTEPALDPDGVYTSKEDVALYIHTYGCLPKNFITKKDAQKLGWTGGSLERYAPGMCIGGDYFGNYEGLLPKAKGRSYTECDIDTLGAKSRGAKRIVFSNDGLIYYTDDHYETFTLLYGEE